MLRRIFGHNGVAERWRKLHDKDDEIKEAEIGGAYSMHKNVVGKPERKRSIGRPRVRWMIILKNGS